MEVWWPPIKVYFTPFINMTLRVLEAFSGVGSQRMALRNLGVNHEVVAVAEIDKFAIKSYEAIHGETFNLGDVSQVEIEDIPEHDLFTYSFPCQDISVAGNGLGLDEGSGTRSGLLWECQKIILGKKPKYLLLENVKNLVGKKHKPNFDKWLEWLEEEGYTNYWQVLNAKNYGVPQNRERVFVVSILGEHEPYEFPEPVELESRLKDVLDEEVDEKFYLTEAQTERLIQNSNHLQDLVNDPKINVLAHRKNYRRNTQVFDPNGITETLDTGQGGGRGHYIPIKNATKKGYLEATHGDGVDLAYPESKTRRGRVQKEISQTLTTDDSKGVLTNFRIRKLTPLECWRLMGFSDEDFYKSEAVNSNSQLYKQAGNSIVVPVLEAIFKQLFKEEPT